MNKKMNSGGAKKASSPKSKKNNSKAPISERPLVSGERIAKAMARAGLCSRRDAESWIEEGRVSVNGEVLTTPAFTITARDKVMVDGAPLPKKERTRLWLYHKSKGTVTTNKDPEGRTTVFDKLPDDMPRVVTIGRLDFNTEGLLLLTNDGGLARVVELPTTGWLRRYRVRAFGKVTQEQLNALADGVAIDGVLYGAVEATLDSERGDNVWLTIGLREGKNREVKKILEHLGLAVNRLIRVSFGPFQLGDLGEGEIQEIRGRVLRDQLGERLVSEADLDFDAPVIHHMNTKEEKPKRERKKSGGAGGGWMSAKEAAAIMRGSSKKGGKTETRHDEERKVSVRSTRPQDRDESERTFKERSGNESGKRSSGSFARKPGGRDRLPTRFGSNERGGHTGRKPMRVVSPDGSVEMYQPKVEDEHKPKAAKREEEPRRFGTRSMRGGFDSFGRKASEESQERGGRGERGERADRGGRGNRGERQDRSGQEPQPTRKFDDTKPWERKDERPRKGPRPGQGQGRGRDNDGGSRDERPSRGPRDERGNGGERRERPQRGERYERGGERPSRGERREGKPAGRGGFGGGKGNFDSKRPPRSGNGGKGFKGKR
ncbi:pseudouridine synthase [Polycladidibacter stylochi]|uniref:pseudouridine synthase n=1 Tax=Polycladidibacter stylochi TaxID=1807766 RepID=UPI000AA9DC6E|nr:pseudouridine synthase [Pseudovibrio stylochi]